MIDKVDNNSELLTRIVIIWRRGSAAGRAELSASLTHFFDIYVLVTYAHFCPKLGVEEEPCSAECNASTCQLKGAAKANVQIFANPGARRLRQKAAAAANLLADANNRNLLRMQMKKPSSPRGIFGFVLASSCIRSFRSLDAKRVVSAVLTCSIIS